MTIIGISLGSSRTAVCVLKDGLLLEDELHMHSFDAQWSEKKLRTIINTYKRYLHRNNVQAIMVKIPPLRKHSKAITQLLKRLDILAKEYDCKFDLITKSELKHVNHLRSTNEIIDFTKRLYPELTEIFEKGIDNDHRYYKKLYEAILGAHTYQEWQRIKALRIADTSK
ncbi:hypothetical protein J3L18_22375 [Mucilaginibacter gossypii]|uniref:hypothetical protein n=1 Tax=Mucilaginibacter gossypii TaxID=551996 RepID=UPI000DCF5B67|nr:MULTISPECIES: hypothetical protein [Mucilaginibacter]QTE35873.1 hypothetical protein J3L18_22375 [Mucilaginibacter gossypii]RAV54679.1 hypothetical protein DIU36_20060 [Mucilaginibacter rubeus]